MRRVAVKIAYLGEGFSGSQIQPSFRNLRTVQGEILERLLMIDHVPEDRIDLKFASRTDAGVSALGNVVTFYTEFKDNDILLKAINSVSNGIYYLAIADVSDSWNPRIAAKRYYRYTCPSAGIDFKKFKEAAEVFQGHHDFQRFAKNETGRSTVMAIDTIDVKLDGDVIITDFCADFYLWNMIRRIMAAVIEVGRGMTDCDDIKRKLAGEDGTFGLAKPDGLTLTDVTYDDVVFTRPSECPYAKNLARDLYKDHVRTSFHKSL